MSTERMHPVAYTLSISTGSFGTSPKSVVEVQRKFQDRTHSTPDAFIRYDSIRLLNEARKTAAGVVNAPTSTVVFVPNATTGINTIFRNLKYEPSDVIIYFSTGYGACQNIISCTAEYTGCGTHCIEVVYPLSDAEIVDKFRSAVATVKSQGRNPKALLFDTISSLPGVRMPYETLTKRCKELGVLSVVDGAHGYGHISLDLPNLDPDFFVSNIHKWGFVNRPCALFYVPQRNQDLIRTTFPTSHYFVPRDSGSAHRVNPLGPLTGEDTPFTKQFEFVGSVDSSPYLCTPAALEFRKEVCGGEEAVQDYCSNLAKDGGALVAKMLGTEVLDNSEGTLTNGISMVNVRLPLHPRGEEGRPGDRKVDIGAKGNAWVSHWAQTHSITYNTFLAFVWHANAWWVRISAQVYLDMTDFELCGVVLKDICAKIVSGEHLQ